MKKVAVFFVGLVFLLAGMGLTGNASAASNQLIIINKSTNTLAFYDRGKLVRTFKVATGRQMSYTPEGTFSIVNKIKNRPYYKDNIRGGDPRNPLGDRWLGLNARGTYGTTYAIHGNNNPISIGTYASSGCIRMYDEEVRWLFDRVQTGTKVVIGQFHSQSFDSIAVKNKYKVSSAPVAQNLCKTKKLSKGQIGFVTIQSPMVLLKEEKGKWVKIRTLNRGERYNVYKIDGIKVSLGPGFIENYPNKKTSIKLDICK
ncbi:L,D-transpeptidase [Priestia megaterium]|uniref:L,D-transpeptidase n=1 Tax=Priestia megaterium TaxID=1404 RepID=UPI002E1F9EB3|nr:L,D-transpeptidase [Priestia megaterium]